jgi:hypothetical protein
MRYFSSGDIIGQENILVGGMTRMSNGVLKGDKAVRIAYGEQSFSELRSYNGLYIDKTMFIPKLINAKFKSILLLRSTRCGKSLFFVYARRLF